MNHLSALRFLAISLLLGVLTTEAQAAPKAVTVGSVDPLSKQVTVFKDLLVQKFKDGSAITKLYGGFSTKSGKYYLVRSGRTATASCMTEVFDLVRLSDNRLVLANAMGKAWNPNIISNLAATFDCTSQDCLFCEPQQPSFGEEPACNCNQGTGPFAGTCGTARPGTTTYLYDDLIIISI